MLDIYVKEFLAITEHLLKQDTCFIKGDYLVVDKKTVEKLMEKNNFEKPSTKLSIWRELRWIETDGINITKKIRVGDKLSRGLCLSIRVQNQLKNL